MVDNFGEYQEGLNSPYTSAFAITPNDSVDLPEVTRGIYIGDTSGGANITVLLRDDTVAQLFPNVIQGRVYEYRIKRVLSTGTNATSLVGLV